MIAFGALDCLATAFLFIYLTCLQIVLCQIHNTAGEVRWVEELQDT